jgi:hypothetical protein
LLATLQVSATDRFVVPGWCRVPNLNAPPEFVGRHFEVMQFDADTKATSHGSHLVTFAPRPEPEIEDDAEAEAQDLLGQTPEFLFDLSLVGLSHGVEPTGATPATGPGPRLS